MILNDLRKATRSLHQQIEGQINLMEHLHEIEDYRAIVGRFYGFHKPIEEMLGRISGWGAAGIDLDSRKKAPLAVADLRALRLNEAQIAALPVCQRLPRLESLADGFGALYVLEGSTLGGQYIRKAVEKSLGLGRASGCAFFQSYGTEVGPMWQSFVNTLEEFAVTHRDCRDAIVRSSVATFNAINEWFADIGRHSTNQSNNQVVFKKT